jgi:hypothetical protein
MVFKPPAGEESSSASAASAGRLANNPSTAPLPRCARPPTSHAARPRPATGHRPARQRAASRPAVRA